MQRVAQNRSTSIEELMHHEISDLKQQLIQLDESRQAGALTAQDYQQSKTLIERKILDLIVNGESPVESALSSEEDRGRAVDQSAESVSAQASDAAGAPSVVLPLEEVKDEVKLPPRRAMRWVAIVAMAMIVVTMVAMYFWQRAGKPIGIVMSEGGTAKPHSASSDQIGSMIDNLAARLKENPGDAAGWAMLARSYGVLGRSDDAVDAYAKAVDLTKNDAALLVDYADALAVKNNRVLAGEPMKLIRRALEIDPRNVKALAMAGTDANDRKDYLVAVKFWEQVGEIGGADNLFAKRIAHSLVEARQLAGLPAGKLTGGFPTSVASAPAANLGLRGTVTVSSALARQIKPEDTVFIFARPAQGSRMPLVILRRQVKDLPIEFTLDDSLAMSASNKLSQAGSVIVGARISKSGNAVPEKGDFAGQSPVVPVGTRGLAIEISETVKQ